MSARGLELTLASLRAQLSCIAWPRYELRLIDAQRRQCLATRYWTAAQLLDPDTVRFLRAYNREGCDVYFRAGRGGRAPVWSGGISVPTLRENEYLTISITWAKRTLDSKIAKNNFEKNLDTKVGSPRGRSSLLRLKQQPLLSRDGQGAVPL